MRDLYEAQRIMRRTRQAALNKGVIGILDIGTSKIVCLILRFDSAFEPKDGGIGAMAGQARFRIIGAATTRSRGVKYGEVMVMKETESAIRTAVQQAQKMAQTRIDQVIACFSGASPRSDAPTSEIEIAEEHVTQADIARVLAACNVGEIGEGREVLHAQPVNFAVDHVPGFTDPRGQAAQVLSADMHLLTVDATAVASLLHCIRRCDLELAGLASAPYVAGRAALNEGDQEFGAVCIDMGGGTTSLSVFVKRSMIHADTIRIGGDNISSDIAIGLQVPWATAERLKVVNGGAQATGLDDREMIPLEGTSGDWEHDRRRVSRAELIGIMRPRLEEILEECHARLHHAGFEFLPSQQIVLTGGVSQTPGLEHLAARILGQHVRMARPLRVHGLPQAASGAGFSAAVGLCLYAAHPQDEWWDFEMPQEGHSNKTLKRALQWFRQNW